jgi:hypothetical protein
VNWRTINDAVTDALRRVTVADMAAPVFALPSPAARTAEHARGAAE